MFPSGLTYIHLLTSRGNYSLRVDLEDFDGTTAYAVYDHFSINGPHDNYRLTISGYHGNASQLYFFCAIALSISQ